MRRKCHVSCPNSLLFQLDIINLSMVKRHLNGYFQNYKRLLKCLMQQLQFLNSDMHGINSGNNIVLKLVLLLDLKLKKNY